MLAQHGKSFSVYFGEKNRRHHTVIYDFKKNLLENFFKKKCYYCFFGCVHLFKKHSPNSPLSIQFLAGLS